MGVYTDFFEEKIYDVLVEEDYIGELKKVMGQFRPFHEALDSFLLEHGYDVANNVAHSYLALTLGEDSYMSKSAINAWKGNIEAEKNIAKEITGYIRQLRHPLFGLRQDKIAEDKAYNVYPSIVTATTSLSGKELAYSLNFPQKSVAGLPVLTCAEFGRNVITYDAIDHNIEKLELGNIFHMNHVEENRVELVKKSLAAHTFITGSTGSGKSNTIYQLLEKARKKNIKFLVVEPAKGEYKNVFGPYKDVSVYGTNPALSPMLRLNPFSFPEKVHILEHLDRLVEIFNVCWPMYAAMPVVLKSAVEKSYKDCGWDIIRSINIYNEKIYPSFVEVENNIKEIIDNSEFDSDNKGAYKGSLLTRLESLTNGINGMIFTCDEISEEELFDENVIVDLSRVGSLETKSLIMGMLVLKLQEYRMAGNMMNVELNHMTVLEEAHNLLRKTSTEQTSESGNLAEKSVEMLTNAIAEMRTYGEGFIIADQAPGLLDMAVIRNTNTKIIMRLPDQTDRELVGKAANLNDDQITELAKLPCGVAAIYQNEWVQPVLCKIDKHKTSDKVYEYKPEENMYLYEKDDQVAQSLLDCIMNKELSRTGNKKDIQELKKRVIRSKLTVQVKKDFMEYLTSDEKTNLDMLRVLIFDFLSAETAIENARQCNDMSLRGDILDYWAKNGASMKEYPIHKGEEKSLWDTIEIAKGKELSLFPFTKKAITNLYMCILQPDYRTPRYLLRDVIERAMRNYLFKKESFPEFIIERINDIPFESLYVSTYIHQQVEESQADRVERFIRVWGNASDLEYEENCICFLTKLDFMVEVIHMRFCWTILRQ